MPHHNVYVIELRPEVLSESSFAAANPRHRTDEPCVYVGLTALSPSERFERHKQGIQACRLVRNYGVRLLPRLYGRYNPLTYPDAVELEKELARTRRRRCRSRFAFSFPRTTASRRTGIP